MSNIVNDIKQHPSLEHIDKVTKKMDEIDSKKNKLKLSIDTVKKQLPSVNVLNTQIITTTVEVKKENDKLSEKEILAVKTYNVGNFYKQIVNNLVIGAKAVYLVCRDLAHAEKTLSTEDFEILKETLPLSKPTISKYLSIGKSTTVKELFNLNRLPESWTCMYQISKCNDDQKKKIIQNVDIHSTQAFVDQLMGKTSVDNKEPTWQFSELESPKAFLQVAVENDKKVADIDPNTLKLISKRVEKVISETLKEMSFRNLKYNVSENERPVKVEVAENKTFLNNVEKKVLEYFKSLKGKETQKEYLNAFNAKQLEITNPIVAKLGS